MYNPNYLYPPINSQNAITWVQGLDGAKAYQLPANANVILMDSELDGIFYIKSSDNIGMSKIRTFKYQEIIQEEKNSNYVTKDEVLKILKEYKDESIISTTTTAKDNTDKGNGEQLQIFEQPTRIYK